MSDTVHSDVFDPIAESLSYDELPVSSEEQLAWKATITVLVPCYDGNGTPVDSQDAACEYLSETLRGQFLDWAYVIDGDGSRTRPEPTRVYRPYIEGSAFA